VNWIDGYKPTNGTEEEEWTNYQEQKNGQDDAALSAFVNKLSL
jgi:hypothetical protein